MRSVIFNLLQLHLFVKTKVTILTTYLTIFVVKKMKKNILKKSEFYINEHIYNGNEVFKREDFLDTLEKR